MPHNSIAENLSKIIAQLTHLNYPTVKFLQPGLSREQIAQYEKKLSFPLTPELVALYQLNNGIVAPEATTLENMWLFPGFYFLPLEEAVAVCRKRQKSPRWEKSWFPVFADGAGDFYVLSCDPTQSNGVIGFINGEPKHAVEYASLTTMLETIAECLEQGAFFINNGNYEIDDDKHQQIALKLNPHIDFWINAVQEKEHLNTRAAAKEQALIAYQLLQEGKNAAALTILEEIIHIPDLPNEVYVNALYAAMPQNHQNTLEPSRSKRVLEISLPHARHQPNIFLNAAFVSIGLGNIDDGLEYFKKAHNRGLDILPYLSDPSLSSLETDNRFIKLKKTCALQKTEKN